MQAHTDPATDVLQARVITALIIMASSLIAEAA